jgi:hypothetical protein
MGLPITAGALYRYRGNGMIFEIEFIKIRCYGINNQKGKHFLRQVVPQVLHYDIKNLSVKYQQKLQIKVAVLLPLKAKL